MLRFFGCSLRLLGFLSKRFFGNSWLLLLLIVISFISVLVFLFLFLLHLDDALLGHLGLLLLLLIDKMAGLSSLLIVHSEFLEEFVDFPLVFFVRPSLLLFSFQLFLTSFFSDLLVGLRLVFFLLFLLPFLLIFFLLLLGLGFVF